MIPTSTMTLDVGPSLLSFLASLLTSVAGFVTLWFSQRATAKKTEEVAKKTEEVAKVLTSDSIEKAKKLEEIHLVVNSRLTKALDEITELKRIIAELTGKVVVSPAPSESVGGTMTREEILKKLNNP